MNAADATLARAVLPGAAAPRMLPGLLLPPQPARWALFVDIDGCIVEFARDPGSVAIPPSLLSLLSDLRDALGGALALVSGRALEQIDRMFAPHRFCAAGQHGFERRSGDGRRHGAPFPRPAAVEHVHRAAHALQQRMPGLLLEDKGASIALHFRSLPELGSAVSAALEDIVASVRDAYEVQPGALVRELKPVACSKGTAVRAFCAEAPFAGRTPVFLGVDVSDESAFGAVDARGGISVCVGTRRAGAARYSLRAPADARAWLTQVLRVSSAGALRA